MKPSANITLATVSATVEQDPRTRAYTLRWTSNKTEQGALILATTDPNVEPGGSDVIAAAALSPFTWVPPDPDATYFFTLLVTGAQSKKVVDRIDSFPAGALEGRWYKACGPMIPEYPTLGYDIVEIVFIGASYRINVRYFADSTCQLAHDSLSAEKSGGQITIGQSMVTLRGQQAIKLNVRRNYQFASDLSPYTIFQIQGDALRFGDTSIYDGSREQDRPDDVIDERIYVRRQSD